MQRIRKDGLYVRSVNTIVSDRKDAKDVVVGWNIKLSLVLVSALYRNGKLC
tara:strand:- start:334 stop:486 length:153 start_codon:yes stop_codon:yes gene_type:complete